MSYFQNSGKDVSSRSFVCKLIWRRLLKCFFINSSIDSFVRASWRYFIVFNRLRRNWYSCLDIEIKNAGFGRWSTSFNYFKSLFSFAFRLIDRNIWACSSRIKEMCYCNKYCRSFSNNWWYFLCSRSRIFKS